MGLISFFSNLPLTVNEGIYSSIAQKMAHGGQLYLNAWDHKPPFIFLAYYFAGLLTKNVEWQTLGLVIFSHILTGFLIALITARLGANRRTSWFCGFLYLVFIIPPAFQTWSAQADLLMQPFLLMALFLAMSSSRFSWFLSGVFWVAAFFFKQSALFYLPVFVYLSFDNVLTLLPDFFWGVNALTAITIIPFVLTDRLNLFWQAVMGINGGYVESGWAALLTKQEFQNRLFNLLGNSFHVYGLITAAIVGTYVFGMQKYRSSNANRKDLAPILFLTCSLLACAVSGAFYSYYFVAIFPGLALMLPMGIKCLAEKPRWHLVVFLAALTLPEIAAAFRFAVNPEGELEKASYSLSRMTAARSVGEYLHQNSSPSDTLLVWGSEPQIYSYSGLQFHGIRTPLVTHLYLIPEEEQQFELSFRLDPPKWFVAGQDAATLPVPTFVTEILKRRFRLVTELGTKKIYKKT